ncbi:Patatin-like phospholipase domain-containing protein [Seminavis robusta]|uniref:Patatin-like phospholipase domain-containing protein n=1 Tax=Seminavis robusta TaxID=568900 RepID=A0A9N8ETI5_9STRA|nr:Patatin-like phospholipase domain-containing protein [Seminavis robusta]|eukprot:Sro1537_g280670.1 Patatin-like phospholipase domain-containing protein (906) ;mRNA; r:10536-13525
MGKPTRKSRQVLDEEATTVIQEDITAESVYDFYRENVLPAIWASLPILAGRVVRDSKDYLLLGGSKFLEFLLPKGILESMEDTEWPSTPFGLQQLWEQTMQSHASGINPNAVEDFLLKHFDSNGDGHIERSELLNMTEFMERWHASVTTPSSWTQWVSREWPLMDWKVGLFLWRAFGGILMTLCVLSIIPGKMHGISARILRWPVLALTYFLIAVELCVYVVIRLGIRLAECLVAKPKHRALRKRMAKAKSYQEWYELASQLDKSQKRDKWQAQLDANTAASKRYNWSFIVNLMKDMKHAREAGDSLQALAVLQQCTRKNVGGIMSEDLFCYTNTGEPMHIVRDFIQEVAKTMEWVTDEALKLPDDPDDDGEENSATIRDYEESLDLKMRHEKDKIWRSLIGFATNALDNFGSGNDFDTAKRSNSSSSFKQQSTGDSVSSLESLAEGQQQQQPPPTLKKKKNKTTLPSFHRKQVADIFKRARAAYGRTALCLSGGSTMGAYHFGHIRGLLEAGVLPNIISGTSAGAVIAAIICTRTDEELLQDMKPEVIVKRLTCFSRSWPDRMKSLSENGNLFSQQEWLDLIRWFTMGDMTFEEAYRKTGRIFCVTVSATTKKAPPVLLNHLTVPNVTLASAVVASAAVPGFIPAMKLQYKMPDGSVRENPRDQTYFDGSIDSDIPVNGLAEMLNCQFFIAAQVNPHIVPFFFNPKGGVGRPCRWSSGAHEHSWRGGFLLATLEMYLKNDMKAKMRFLHDMEAAVGFTSTLLTQEFHGSTTLVPQVSIIDYPKLFSDLNLNDLYRVYQGGSITAYEHTAMIKTHYRIADTLDNCLEALRTGKRELNPSRDRPVLRIECHPPVETIPLEPARQRKGSENDTLSTHSSVHDGDDDTTSTPSKWETIQPRKETMERS